MPRRLLMIAPYFPPRRRVGARRPHHLSRHLPASGVEPLVVCLGSKHEQGEQLAQVRRFNLYTPLDRTEVSGGGSGGSGKVSWLDAHTPVDTWWPLLVAQTSRVVRAAREFQADVVWSTADPWSSHSLALRVARALELPWIADFRDPWSLCRVRTRGRPGWVRRIDARVEASVLSSATLTTFTSQRTCARYREAYPRLAARFHTLENAFDAADYGGSLPTELQPKAVAARPELVLTFFGRFRALSSAGRAIALLSAARAIDPEARIVVRSQGGLGDDDRARAEAAGIAGCFESFPACGGRQALELLASSDLLLLSSELGRDEIIPAKLFDYLAAARPIFSLCENPDVADILARTGTGVQFAEPDLRPAAEALIACARAKRGGSELPLNLRLDLEAREALSAGNASKRLSTLLSRL